MAVLLVACNGQLPLLESFPVLDAAMAAPPTQAPPTAPPTAPPPVDAGVDAALPDGGTGFRIVAGAAIVEAVPERKAPRVAPRAPTSAPASAAPASAALVTAPPRGRTPIQAIRAQQGDVSTCYGRVALKDPSVRGRITVQWTIGRDGVPIAVAITEDTLKDKSVGACIKDKARAWRFPPPTGGVQVISYPFDLRVQ